MLSDIINTNMTYKDFFKKQDNEITENIDVSKSVDPKEVNLRSFDFKPGQCNFCKYWNPESKLCVILQQKVLATQVCDAFQGDRKRSKDVTYKVKPEDFQDFVKGMVKEQPYQHIVVKGLETPVGPLIIIKDTMKPKPHIFSLDAPFHMDHTSAEHHWTQEEVDKLIKDGK